MGKGEFVWGGKWDGGHGKGGIWKGDMGWGTWDGGMNSISCEIHPECIKVNIFFSEDHVPEPLESYLRVNSQSYAHVD